MVLDLLDLGLPPCLESAMFNEEGSGDYDYTKTEGMQLQVFVKVADLRKFMGKQTYIKCHTRPVPSSVVVSIPLARVKVLNQISFGGDDSELDIGLR